MAVAAPDRAAVRCGRGTSRKIEGVSRAKVAALGTMGLLLLAVSSAALCGWTACSQHAAPMSCHPAPTSPRLSDCCAAQSASPSVAYSLLAALAAPRTASAVTPASIEPGAAAAPPSGDIAGRHFTLGLFTLHHALLL
jgi:hypothetical protein